MIQRKIGLLSSGLLYGVGGGIQRLIGFLLLPLFTRYLSPADYGIVSLLSATSALLLPIFSLGLSASIGVFYFATDDSARRRTIICTARWITYASATLMLIPACATIGWISHIVTNSPNYEIHTFVAIVTVALNVLCLPFQLEQQLSNRPLEFVSISLFGAVFASASNIAFVVYFDLGALGMLLGGLSGQFLVWVLLLLKQSGRKKDERGAVSFDLAKSLLQHGLPMLISFILLFIMQNAVRWPLERAHGVDAVGLYSIGTNFGAAITLFTSGFVVAWMPWAMTYSDKWEDGRIIVARRLMQYMIVGGILVLLFFCVAQPILWILTSPSYFDAWMVVGLVAASNFMVSFFSLLLPPVYIEKKVYLVLISQSIGALITIFATYLLLDFGIVGAALAVLIGSFALVGAQIVVNIKLTRVREFPFEWFKILECLTLIALASWASFSLDVSEGVGYIFQVLLLFLVASIIALRHFPEKRLFLNMISKGMK